MKLLFVAFCFFSVAQITECSAKAETNESKSIKLLAGTSPDTIGESWVSYYPQNEGFQIVRKSDGRKETTKSIYLKSGKNDAQVLTLDVKGGRFKVDLMTNVKGEWKHVTTYVEPIITPFDWDNHTPKLTFSAFKETSVVSDDKSLVEKWVVLALTAIVLLCWLLSRLAKAKKDWNVIIGKAEPREDDKKRRKPEDEEDDDEGEGE